MCLQLRRSRNIVGGFAANNEITLCGSASVDRKFAASPQTDTELNPHITLPLNPKPSTSHLHVLLYFGLPLMQDGLRTYDQRRAALHRWPRVEAEAIFAQFHFVVSGRADCMW